MNELFAMTLCLAPLVAMSATSLATDPEAGRFKLPPLPYVPEALEPSISAKTMGFHYGKHHQAYVDNLNKLTAKTAQAGKSLETLVQETSGTPDKAPIFNNAAQVWNHTFFWRSMKKGGGDVPDGRLLKLINKSFGSFDSFRTNFITTALGLFGSGWVWLVQDGNDLKIVTTGNADTPIVHGQTPLLTCDVWEHAYYLDYQNRRKDYVEAFLDHLANWDFAESLLK